jgi:hypothetical protein
VAIVAAVAGVLYWTLRALRYRSQADTIRAAGKFMVGEIERERGRRAVGCRG